MAYSRDFQVCAKGAEGPARRRMQAQAHAYTHVRAWRNDWSPIGWSPIGSHALTKFPLYAQCPTGYALQGFLEEEEEEGEATIDRTPSGLGGNGYFLDPFDLELERLELALLRNELDAQSGIARIQRLRARLLAGRAAPPRNLDAGPAPALPAHRLVTPTATGEASVGGAGPYGQGEGGRLLRVRLNLC